MAAAIILPCLTGGVLKYGFVLIAYGQKGITMTKFYNHLAVLIFAAVLVLSVSPVVVEQAEARGKISVPPVLGKIIGKVIGKAGIKSRTRSGSGSERILSKQELHSCINRDTDIEAARVKLDSQLPEPPSEQSIDSLKLEIDKSARAIDEMEIRIRIADPLVDLYSESSVNAFNAMLRKSKLEIDKHNALVARHKRIVVLYNSDLDAYKSEFAQHKLAETAFNSEIDRYNSECAHLYYVDDMNEILAERR